MKKIIAITAMAATMAAAAMAAEVSARAKVAGSLVDGSTKENSDITFLKIEDPNSGHYDWSQTGIFIEFNGEKAGGKLTVDQSGSLNSTTVWIKPIEMLKLTFGNAWYGLNTESIDWTTAQDAGGYGYSMSLTPVAGLTIDAALLGGWKYNIPWFDGDKFNTTVLKVGYGADFGTVSALLKFDQVTDCADLVFGAGYAGSAGPVSFFADVWGYVEPSADKPFDQLMFDAFAAFTQDALTVKGYAKFTLDTNAAENTKTNALLGLNFKAYASYNLGAATPYVVVKSDDVIADHINLVVKPGVTFNVGECACDVAAQLTFDADADTVMKFSVPVAFSVNL